MQGFCSLGLIHGWLSLTGVKLTKLAWHNHTPKLENIARLALMFHMMSVIMSNHVAAVRLARYIHSSAEYPWLARIREWQELLGRVCFNKLRKLTQS